MRLMSSLLVGKETAAMKKKSENEATVNDLKTQYSHLRRMEINETERG